MGLCRFSYPSDKLLLVSSLYPSREEKVESQRRENLSLSLSLSLFPNSSGVKVWCGQCCHLPRARTRLRAILMNLSKDVFERRASTGSGLFSFLDSGFAHLLGQLVSIIVKTLRNTNLGASRCFKMKKTSLPVDVRRSKTPLLKLPISDRVITGDWAETCNAWLIPRPNAQISFCGRLDKNGGFFLIEGYSYRKCHP